MHTLRTAFFVAVAAVTVTVLPPSPAVTADAAQPRATAREVVEKVRAAVALLKRDGEAALEAFRGKDSAFVWKDSYVFVSDCGRGIILAHPFQPAREGKRIADGPTYNGVTAAQRAEAQCRVAARPGGGWWPYSFSRPGAARATRKVSYLMMVPDRTWIVGAGVYDDTTPIEKFEAIGRAMP